jgi:nucleosome binding factor SPN SPT16 subunit
MNLTTPGLNIDSILQFNRYAISLADTVKIGPNGATVMSEGMKSKDDVHFFTPAEEKKSTKTDRSKNGGKPSPRKATATTIVKSKLRGEGREIDHSAAINRKAHQKELAAKLHAVGVDKYAEDGGNGKAREKQWKRFESYARDTQLPDTVAAQRVSSFLSIIRKRND